MTNKLVLLIIFFIMIIKSVNATEESRSNDFYLPKNPTLAAALSIAVPGAGQIYNEKYLKSGLVIATQISLFSTVLYYDKKVIEYRKKIREADEINYAHQVKYKDYHESRQSFYFWLGASVLLSGLDAYVDAHLFNFKLLKNEVNLRFEDNMLNLSVEF